MIKTNSMKKLNNSKPTGIKVQKKIFVPLNSIHEAALVELKEWVTGSIPAWKECIVATSGKYLGVILGPTAQAKQFTEHFTKWAQRSRAISATYTSLIISAFTYNVHACSCTSFLSQFLLLPPPSFSLEPSLIASLAKVPFGLSWPASARRYWPRGILGTLGRSIWPR